MRQGDRGPGDVGVGALGVGDGRFQALVGGAAGLAVQLDPQAGLEAEALAAVDLEPDAEGGVGGQAQAVR